MSKTDICIRSLPYQLALYRELHSTRGVLHRPPWPHWVSRWRGLPHVLRAWQSFFPWCHIVPACASHYAAASPLSPQKLVEFSAQAPHWSSAMPLCSPQVCSVCVPSRPHSALRAEERTIKHKIEFSFSSVKLPRTFHATSPSPHDADCDNDVAHEVSTAHQCRPSDTDCIPQSSATDEAWHAPAQGAAPRRALLQCTPELQGNLLDIFRVNYIFISHPSPSIFFCSTRVHRSNSEGTCSIWPVRTPEYILVLHKKERTL